MRRLLLLPCLLLAACNAGDSLFPSTKDMHLTPLTEIKANLAFTCSREKIPEPSTEADALFQYARWLQKGNLLKQDKAVDAEIERLYRIASENGHYKANINLQNGAMRGHFKLRGEEHLRMSQQLIESDVATGYYFIAIFLKRGAAGLKQNSDMALRYFRRAANQGSAQAQVYISNKLAPIDIAPDVARELRHCAARQGNGDAANALGVNYSGRGDYQEALEAFQLGVAAGNSSSASFLGNGFRGPKPDNRLYYLGQQEDFERVERYKKIQKILSGYSYANPTVPEINEIVPLPPAKLPEWDGKLQWLEAWIANVPPPKPDESRIRQLANAKALDPASGRPMPGSQGFIQATSPMPTCYSGQCCPQTGYWQVAGLLQGIYSVSEGESLRRFEQGQVMPTCVMRTRGIRFIFFDKTTVREERVQWRLFGEA
jgi:TPR repeat protein